MFFEKYLLLEIHPFRVHETHRMSYQKTEFVLKIRPKKNGLKAKCSQKIHRFPICLAFVSECLSGIWSHCNASTQFFRVKAHSKNTVGIPVAVVFLFVPPRITMVSRAPLSLFGGRWIYQGRVTKQFNFHVSVAWWVLVAVFLCFFNRETKWEDKRRL